MDFAERLKELLKEENKTITEVSEGTGISRPTISRYASGDRKPKIEQAQKIADYFKVPLEYIQGVTDDKDGFDLWEDATGHNKKTIMDVINRLKKDGATSGDLQQDIGLAVSTLEGLPSGFGTESAVKYATQQLGAISSSTEDKYFRSSQKVKNAPENDQLLRLDGSTKVILSSENNWGEDYYYDSVDPRVMQLIRLTMKEARRVIQLGEPALKWGRDYDDTNISAVFEEFEEELRKLLDN